MRERLRSSLRPLTGRWAMFLLRLALGGLFIASSLSKLEHPNQFSTSVLSYHMLPDTLARPFATALPFAELFIGCSLVLGICVLFASALTIPLSLSLAIANIYALARHVGGENCPCLGSLVTMTHSAALAIDIAMLVSGSLLAARHERAESLGIGPLLRIERLGLNKTRRRLLGLSIVALGMIGAIALVGVHRSPTAAAIDEGLAGSKVVLVFRYEGDPEAIYGNLVVLYETESRFGDAVYIYRCATGQDLWADRRFTLRSQMPALFVLTGRDSSSFVVTRRLEGNLDAAAVESAVLEILSQDGAESTVDVRT